MSQNPDSRDERHDSIDPATGALTDEALALRANGGVEAVEPEVPTEVEPVLDKPEAEVPTE